MIPSIKEAVDELAHHLDGLRRRFRASARVEVGRAVGGALHDLALDAICGTSPTPSRTPIDDWDDPWQERPARWEPDAANETLSSDAERVRVRVRGALLAGLTAGRWALQRLHNPALAAVIGFLVALAAFLGGPTIERSIEAWLSARELLGPAAGD